MDPILLEQRLKAFEPAPLFDKTAHEDSIEIPVVPPSGIDLAKADYLNITGDPAIKQCAEDVIRKYGVGTCGPRAFYGTTDVHLDLEEKLAQFFGLEDAIVYSFGFVAISSSIAAYCKGKDVVFIDEKANIAIEQGLTAARSHVVKFDHNSPESLQRILENGHHKGRKFLILEGVSWETGQIADLPKFLEIAEQNKMRVFLEETYSFGVFGETGRGLTEHYGIDPARVDMIFATLEGPIGSIGGFCVGSALLIDHQRLSGSGYIFSASLPTYLAEVVIKSLELVPERAGKLRELSRNFQEFLENLGITVLGDKEVPFKILSLTTHEDEEKFYQYCKDKEVFFIKRDKGLMINLNVTLLDDKKKMDQIKAVFEEAWAAIS